MLTAKENETRELFEKNFQLLSPWLKEMVMKISNEEMWDRIEVTYTKEGHPVCRYREGDKSFGIVSRQPVREAEIWCDSALDMNSSSVILFGSGFGYPIFEIFKRKMSHTLVIVFERDIFLFKAMLHYFDFEPLLATKKLIFMVGGIKDFEKNFNLVLFSINFYACMYPSVLFTPAARRQFKAPYLDIYEYVFSQLSLIAFLIGNDHLDNLIGFCNLIGNAGEVLRNPYISCLKDRYRGVPAFIVANGPSLDKNIGQLTKIKGKGLVIAVESAIVPLIKNNVSPDVLTVIERSKATYQYHFESREFPEDMALLCLAMVDRHVLPAFKGKKIPIFRTGEAMNRWISRYIGDGSSIEAGANVSHLALGIAAYLGADPIVFVGQDYAYGAEGVTHSKDAAYYEEVGKSAREFIQTQPVVYVEGNDGTMIPSNQVWTDFKGGLELQIALNADRHFINATEGGARIKGTDCMSLKQAIEQYCVRPLPAKVSDLIGESEAEIQLAERRQRLEDFIGYLENFVETFRGYVRETIRGKLDCKTMVRLSEAPDREMYREVLNETFIKNLRSFELFTSDDLCRHFTQQEFFVYYYLTNRLGRLDRPEKITETFKTQYNLYSLLNAVCQSLSVHLEDALFEMQDELAHFDEPEERA